YPSGREGGLIARGPSGIFCGDRRGSEGGVARLRCWQGTLVVIARYRTVRDVVERPRRGRASPSARREPRLWRAH
ncbi:MAG: hypothetical protein M3259_02540, partial [Actinomycetota bacterium]|nr:hypothetical protein [Actinomycetota bacterium]